MGATVRHVRSLIYAVTLVALATFAACAGGAKPNVRPKIVTTTGMIGDMVRRIAGPQYDIVTLMGPGVDPHLYKASQGDLMHLESADIIFFNGLHLEGKMAEVLERFAKHKPCFPVSADLPEARLRRPPEFEGNFDPHIWFDVALWSETGRTVLRRLQERFPDSSSAFRTEAERYFAELGQLDAWVRNEIAAIPATQRVLITAHDAFGYFGRAYGIEVMGLQGISTASEFGLHDLTNLVSTIISRKVKAVFVESSVPQKFVLALQEGVRARGHEVVVGGELFSDAMGAAGTAEGTYVGMIRHNVNTVVKALR